MFKKKKKQKPETKQETVSKRELIELFTKSKVESLFPGEWESVFKGSGYEFWDVREFQPGDAFRRINWRVTGRTGNYHINQFLAESYASVMILYDLSESIAYGNKELMQALIAASIAHTALSNNNDCGLIMFSDDIDVFIKPAGGDVQFQIIMEAILSHDPKPCDRTALHKPIQALQDKIPRSLSFVISDFVTHTHYKRAMEGLNKGDHDLMALITLDHNELALDSGSVGIVDMIDSETGDTFCLDLSKDAKLYEELIFKHKLKTKDKIVDLGFDSEILTSDEKFMEHLKSMMRKRKEKSQ